MKRFSMTSLTSLGISAAMLFATVGCEVDVQEGQTPEAGVIEEPAEDPQPDLSPETEESEVEIDAEPERLNVPDVDVDVSGENEPAEQR